MRKRKITFKGIDFLGIRTKKFHELENFFENILKLPRLHSEPGFRAYNLSNGDRIELFSYSYKTHKHFTTGPVAGFAVDDIRATRKEMKKNGIKFFGPIHGRTTKWSHFQGPDGNVYEITNRKR